MPGAELLIHRVKPLGGFSGVALGDGEIGQGQHGETAEGFWRVHVVGHDGDRLICTGFTSFEAAEGSVETGAGAESGDSRGLASETGQAIGFVVGLGGISEFASFLEVVGDVGNGDGGEGFARMARGEGAASGFVLAGGEFFAEGFAAAFVPEEEGEEGQDAYDDAKGTLDDDVLVALPEEPEAVLGVRIHEILVDDDEITVVAGRGLLVGTVFRHGGSTLGKGPFVSTPASPAYGLVPAPGWVSMGGLMSASAAVLSLLQAAQAKGQISASSLANAGDWLRSGALPATAIDALKDLSDRGAWAEIEDRFYKGIAFGTGGMRGRTVGRVSAANELDPQGLPVRAAIGSACLNDINVLRAVIGLWKHVSATQPGARLVVAHDVRHFSRHFAELIAGAWTELGGEAYLFVGARSTPQLSFTVRHLGAHAGVVITASHNPSHDNGFKCCLGDGGQVLPPHDAAIVAEVGKLGPADIAPYLETDISRVLTVPASAEDAYLARLAGVVLDPEVISRHTPKVVFTNVHGTGDVMVVPALRRVGIDPHLVEEQREHDGRFPTVASPNPENASTFALALKLADEIGADLILATDPDSDRVGVACPLPAGGHRLLNGNEVAALLTEFRISSLKDAGILPEAGSSNAAVVKSLVTTPLVAAICARHGIRCVETLVGFKWIARKLEKWSRRLAEGAGAEAAVLPLRRRAPLALRHSMLFLLGAEESYGYLADDAVRDKDANATVVMLCEFAALLRSRGRTLLDALDVLHLSYGAHHEDLLNLSFEGAEGAACIRRIVASWRATPPSVIDGSKVVRVTDYERDKVLDAEGERVPPEEFILAELADGRRIAVRASGTEPKAKFYSFTKAEVADADDLTAARERARKSALALRAWLEADAKRRAK